jgi:ribosomal protein L31E
MNNHKFIFICGLHRSGTSLLYKILKEQDAISGMENTQVIEDEGQHLQTVFNAANKHGGPGKFGFDTESYLDNNSKLITEENKVKLFNQWSKYWDLKKEFLIEKSPPNLIKTKFLQAIFPNSYFITILRHPVATSLATKKWSKTSHLSLINHWLICHNQYLEDRGKLNKHLTIKYEDLTKNTSETIKKIETFLELNIKYPQLEIKKDINEKYFELWKKNKKNIFFKRNIKKSEELEKGINLFGYSFKNI